MGVKNMNNGDYKDILNIMADSKIDWTMIKEPIEISAKEYNNFREKYIFSEQVEHVKKLCCNFARPSYKKVSNLHKESKNIAVIGDRGTGKTSILRTIKNVLEEGFKGNDEDDGNLTYYVFDIVDPSIFDSSLNILEILMSNIYNEINKEVDLNKDSILKQQASILRKLKKINQTLSNLRKQDTYFKENNPAIEVLEDINTRIKFNQKLKELLEEFKEYMEIKNGRERKYTDLVLIIDDIDLIENKEIYKMVNDLQNFLSGNLILILGYREEQLVNSIASSKIEENENLIKYSEINIEEIRNQSINIIDKLIPYNNRCYLYMSKDITVYQILSSIITSKNQNVLDQWNKIYITDWVAELIFYRTNIPIIPIQENERTSYNLPENLRGILQLLELLIDGMDEHDIKKAYLSYYKNVLKLKKYVMSRMEDRLNRNEFKFIVNWDKKNVETKNYYCYKYLFDRIMKEEPGEHIKESLLDINSMVEYNVCIGDIYLVLDIYKTVVCKGELDYFFVYTVKILYSIELLTLYLSYLKEGVKELEEAILEDYLKLINVRIMPDNMMYVSNNSNDLMNMTYINIKESKVYKIAGKDITVEKREYEDFLNKIFYSDISSSGKIRPYARPNVGNTNVFNKSKFRNAYNYGELGSTRKLVDKWIYPTDPFSYLGKANYLRESKEEILKGVEDKKEYSYIFYSLFDVDMFLIKTYERESQDNIYEYILRRINTIFNGELTLKLELELFEKLGKYSFLTGKKIIIEKNYRENEGEYYRIPYEEKNLELAQVFLSSNEEEIERNAKLNTIEKKVDQFLSKSYNKVNEKEKNKILVKINNINNLNNYNKFREYELNNIFNKYKSIDELIGGLNKIGSNNCLELGNIINELSIAIKNKKEMIYYVVLVFKEVKFDWKNIDVFAGFRQEYISSVVDVIERLVKPNTRPTDNDNYIIITNTILLLQGKVK